VSKALTKAITLGALIGVLVGIQVLPPVDIPTLSPQIDEVNIFTGPNDAPIAEDQALSTKQNTPLPNTLAALEADGDPLTYAVVDGPANGSRTGTPPDVTCTPDPNYSGADSFSFRANDGTVDSNLATVTIKRRPRFDDVLALPFVPCVEEDAGRALAHKTNRLAALEPAWGAVHPLVR
jgi:hypothetical protein